MVATKQKQTEEARFTGKVNNPEVMARKRRICHKAFGSVDMKQLRTLKKGEVLTVPKKS